jgi:nucleotide-binding universal stress UspA family protein
VLPLRKILWPTDFSEPSQATLNTANELALHFSAELMLVHVVPSLPIIPTTKTPIDLQGNSYPLEMESAAREALRRRIKEDVSEEVKTNAVVIHGNSANVADEIVNIAEREETDVIVIATHGQTGWRRFIFGSVAENVIKTAPCPVLSIQVQPEEAEE